MDEKALNELLECSVCLEQLDSSNKVLPCQHTFCRCCLEEIVGAKEELRCPECRSLVEIPVDTLPSNILLIRLLEGLKTQNKLAGMLPVTSASGSKDDVSVVLRSSPQIIQQSHQKPKPVSTSRPCAKASYNYEALDPSDLSFLKDEIVLLRRQVDDNWFFGEIHGKHGFFPASYVQVIIPLPDSSPKCKALYDFQINNKDSEKDCLFFKRDDVLTVLRRVDDNWAEGKLGDKIGIFPIAFVEFNHAAKELLSKHVHKSNPPHPTSSNSMPSVPSTSKPSASAFTTPLPTASSVIQSLSHSSEQSSPPILMRQPRSSINNDDSHPSPHIPLRHASSSQHTPHARRNDSPRSGASSPGTGSTAVNTPPIVHKQQSFSIPTPAMATVLSSSAPHVQITTATSVPKLVSQSSQVISSGRVPTSPTTPSGQNLGPPPNDPPPPPPPIYVALYNYKPQKDDELQLVRGENYTVSEKCQDGWFKGLSLKTGKLGVFPGNYVQLVKHTIKSVSPIRSPLHPPVSGQESVEHQQHSSLSESQQPPALPPKTGSHGESLTFQPPPPTPARNQDDVHVMCQVPSRRNSAPAERNITIILPPQKYNKPLPAAPSTPEHSTNTSVVSAPPNVMVTAGAEGMVSMMAHKSGKTKDKRDKGGLIKYLKQHSRSKGSSTKVPPSVNEISDNTSTTATTHLRSSSLSSLDSSGVIFLAGPVHDGVISSVRTMSLVDNSSTVPMKPARPKPLRKERYRCVVPYPCQSDIELELKVGDVVYVHKKRDDGWFKGTQARTGKVGLFPQTFVEIF